MGDGCEGAATSVCSSELVSDVDAIRYTDRDWAEVFAYNNFKHRSEKNIKTEHGNYCFFSRGEGEGGQPQSAHYKRQNKFMQIAGVLIS